MNIYEEIKQLKKQKNAVILAHNYQILEVQNTADFIGDSLQLARQAAETDAEIILFCGVQFMAETAKLLKPESKVLLSKIDAGCPMADMINRCQLLEFKKNFNDPVIVCYVNSSVEVKAESDICCTSGNAVKIVNSIPPEKKVLFVPDQNLGTYARQQTGRNITVWKGFCNVHHNLITLQDVEIARRKYPDYYFLAHPECRPEVFAQADVVASTKGMADFVKSHNKVILGTEIGLVEQLQARYPQKKIVPASSRTICVNMKKTTLVDVLETLKTEKNEIIIPDETAGRAVRSINRMLEIS